MPAIRCARPIAGAHLDGAAGTAVAGHRSRECTWAGVLAGSLFEPQGQLWDRRPRPEVAEARTLSLCPKSELEECGLARWRRDLGRQPGLRNPNPAALTPGLCLVSNVNLPDSREFAQKPKPSIRRAAAVVAAVWLRLVGITNSN